MADERARRCGLPSSVVVPQLTSGVSSLTASDGLFCDGQVAPGAFGLAAARGVTESGTAPTLAGTALQMNLAATFCIAPTGTFLDNIVGLPGVGALSAPGEVDITELLLPELGRRAAPRRAPIRGCARHAVSIAAAVVGDSRSAGMHCSAVRCAVARDAL